MYEGKDAIETCPVDTHRYMLIGKKEMEDGGYRRKQERMEKETLRL